jgi:uroporphyrinogen-III synthase
VLIARAAVARDLLPRELVRRGAQVDVVEAYQTIAPQDLPQRATRVLALEPDWITFTSSSTVQNLVNAVGADALRHIRTVSIGPITSATLRQNGLPVAVEAPVYTVAGLTEALLKAIIEK